MSVNRTIKADAWLERLYARYNRLYFRNRLPKHVIVAWGIPGKRGFKKFDLGHSYFVAWAEKRGPSGKLIWKKKNVPMIEISSLFDRRCIIRGTLLHEMAHIALPARCVRGARFQAEMLRLAKAGAFRGIW